MCTATAPLPPGRYCSKEGTLDFEHVVSQEVGARTEPNREAAAWLGIASQNGALLLDDLNTKGDLQVDRQSACLLMLGLGDGREWRGKTMEWTGCDKRWDGSLSTKGVTAEAEPDV